MAPITLPTHKARLNGLLSLWFAVAVFLLPIDCINGLPFFGELSIAASFYAFLPLVVAAAPLLVRSPAYSRIAPEVKWFVILMLASIFASFIVNGSDIAEAELRGRAGLNKLATTTVAFLFCVTLVFLSARFSQYPEFYKKVLMKPTLLSLFVVIIVSLIELVARWSGAASSLYANLSGLFRGASVNYLASPDRLNGISAEPSTMAVFLGYALVCLSIESGLMKRGSQRSFYRPLIYLAVTFFILTMARTAYLILLGMGLFLLARPWIIGKKAPKSFSSFSFLWLLSFIALFCLLIFLSINDDIAQEIIHGTSASNLSRYASNYTAFKLFLDRPFMGIGFGQYAFQAREEMPQWAWSSREIVNWYTNTAKAWPSTFSTPARVAAELGLFGIFAWYLPILCLFRKLIFVVKKERERLQKTPPIGSALLLGMVYFLLYNVSQESFRHFEAWIILGFVSSYVGLQEPEGHYDMPPVNKKPVLGPSSPKRHGANHVPPPLS